MSRRRPAIGSQHLSRGMNGVPADWSSSSVALPVDSLADERLGPCCWALFAFCRPAVVPSALSSEGVREKMIQPVRRCITHLLPVGPTCVGGTVLASQDAPCLQRSGDRFPGHGARILSPPAGLRLLKAKTQTGALRAAHGCRERWRAEDDGDTYCFATAFTSAPDPPGMTFFFCGVAST